MRTGEFRAAELEERLRMQDWAALEGLSRMWREGRIPKDRALEILALILPEDAGEKTGWGEGLKMGECRVGEGERGIGF